MSITAVGSKAVASAKVTASASAPACSIAVICGPAVSMVTASSVSTSRPTHGISRAFTSAVPSGSSSGAVSVYVPAAGASMPASKGESNTPSPSKSTSIRPARLTVTSSAGVVSWVISSSSNSPESLAAARSRAISANPLSVTSGPLT